MPSHENEEAFLLLFIAGNGRSFNASLKPNTQFIRQETVVSDRLIHIV